MKPILLQFGNLDIPTNLALLVLGMCVLLLLSMVGAGRSLPRHHIALMMVSMYVFAIAGARLLFVLEHPEFHGRAWQAFLSPYPGGFSSYGGVFAAAFAAIVYAMCFGLPVARIADSASMGLCISGALVRLGCFAAGCCYGHPTLLPWGVAFPEGSEAAVHWGLGVHVHPTQLYESGGLIGIAMLIYLFRKTLSFHGERFLWVVSLYTGIRFFNDFLRGDSAHLHGLTLGQWVSLPLVLISSLYISLRYRSVEMGSVVTAEM